MTLLHVLVVSAIALAIAYRLYGRFLTRWLSLDPDRPTPAVEMRDGVDYEPISPRFLISQHFSAIAAAGPIVGPILAGLMFGWFPALLWILFGAVFIGGVHDMTALFASLRHRANSIAEVVREHMSPRAYLLFLSFVWIALVYIIVAFTDVVAQSFVGEQTLEDGTVISGAGVAMSSLLYLLLPVIMGALLRYTRLSLGLATAIFLPLVGVAIWAGQLLPLTMPPLFGLAPNQVWDVLLLAYCFVASVVPVWALLQPRGHLGGYFLFIALIGGFVGLVFSGRGISYPAFMGWESLNAKPMFPILFITIACGACSGFHSIIASGTTSKQLRCETDARPIGYGAMLLEGLVAVVSLACVMMLVPGEPTAQKAPNFIYAQGIGEFLHALGIPRAAGVTFALMAFTTFVYDTLDVCTRLGRYILQELTGWTTRTGRLATTLITSGTPLVFVMQRVTDGQGSPIPAWRVFWELFGASNQLLAALTLLGVTVWLWRARGMKKVWLVTGAPTLFMYVMSVWALLLNAAPGVQALASTGAFTTVSLVAIVLAALALLLLVEAVRIVSRRQPPSAVVGEAFGS
jgi:carbon starvation protein